MTCMFYCSIYCATYVAYNILPPLQVCYYKAIEYCIAHNLSYMEPGAGQDTPALSVPLLCTTPLLFINTAPDACVS